jgi:hypothetical protein
VPTVYGPGLQAVFALSAWVSPGRVWPLKIILWIALVALALALRGLCTADQEHSAWLALMKPTLFFESALNAHPDLIAIALMTWALRCGAARPALAGLLMALCLACRLQGLIVLPFFLWVWPWSGRFAWALTTVAIYGPLGWAGAGNEFAAIRGFGEQWEFNSSLFALLGSGTAARNAAFVIASLAAAVAFVKWVGTGAGLDRCPALLCIGSALVCSAVFNPWYALWMLPFIVLQSGSTWRYAWIALPGLSYITAGNLGSDSTNAFAHPAWVRPLEFSLLAGAAWLASRDRAHSQSSHSSTSRQVASSSHDH